MQRDFWVKIGVGGNGCAKRLLGKIGVLGEMSTFRLKMGFGENGHAKRLLGKK